MPLAWLRQLVKATFSGRHLAVLFLTLFTPAGAGVESADGSWQPIESIQEGDLVWAHDPETGEKGVREVVTFFDAHLEESMVTITLGDDTLTATQHHPFWSVTRSAWIDAGDLFVGEYLLQADGGVDVVDAVHRYELVTTVYNFEVEGLHTYFVEVDGEGVLVHNCATGARIFSGGTGETFKVSEHAAQRMAKRQVSEASVSQTLGKDSFGYFHEGVAKRGFYDPDTKVFVGTLGDEITTVIDDASEQYIRNLRAAQA